MNNFTTETYIAKREILTYAEKLAAGLSRPKRKFVSDMLYGMTASGSVLLTDISSALQERAQKVNTVDRLSRHLADGPMEALKVNYAREIRGDIPDNPVVLLDDSDVIKPHGRKFESLGYVRDGSSKDGKREKGYFVTEAVALSKENQPVSLYSHIHSQYEKDFKSTNTYTYRAIDAAAAMVRGRATFVCDRGYDSNEMFRRFYDKGQYFIIRLTEKRKIFFKGKWYDLKTLMKARKGKFKTTLRFRGGDRECYVSFINAQITAGKKQMRLVVVYGLGDMPMVLATNRPIMGKDDVVSICRTYLSRWRIEEYFRFKKQYFGFEGFRVRSLKSIVALNDLLSFAISCLNRIIGKKENHCLKNAALGRSRALRKKVFFHYYRIAKGIRIILASARTGIGGWFKSPPRVKSPQLALKLIC